MGLDGDRWRQIRDLFERVADVDADERRAVLGTARIHAPEVVDAVERMLVADLDRATLFEDPRRWTTQEPAPDEPDLPEGHRLGPYRIVRRIGRGGMGAVYLAEREHEFSMRVAIKVVRVRPGPDRDEPARRRVIAERFRRERQILATLQHPHIARLLDGGESGDGRPYLVMEYVEGRPLLAFCDEERLSIARRIDLFLQVTEAVEFAHRNLVVHRDLKPSNVLVTDAGEVKLLDFGIARVLEDPSGDADLTQTGVTPLTPEYASPEQFRGEPLTTASDIYQLGLLLYEVLVGRRPFPAAGSAAQRMHAVLSGDPVRPSAMGEGTTDGEWAADGDGGPTSEWHEIAARRLISPEGLRRRLRGDLDTILLKALRKEPERRYATAVALRDDLERYQTGRPVHARSDTRAYRLRKFVGRHPVAVTAGLAGLVLTTVFGTVYNRRITQERDRAAREAERAEAVSDFLVGALRAADPRVAQGAPMTVLEMLDSAVVHVDEVEGQPELQARLLTTFGAVYRSLGRFDEAAEFLDRAATVFATAPEADSLLLADALTESSMVSFDLRRYEEAKEPTRRALAIRRARLGNEHPDVLTSLSNLATLAGYTEDAEESIRRYSEILEIRRRILPEDDPAIGVTLNNLGMTYYAEGRYAEAEPVLRETLELRRRALSATDPDIALALNNLGSAVRELGRLDEAATYYEEALDIRRAVYGDRHPRVAVSLFNLGQLAQRRGEPLRAVGYFREALAIDVEVYGPDHTDIGIDSYQLGVALTDSGEVDEALGVLGDAERIFSGAFEPTHRRLVLTRKEIGRALLAAGRPGEADPVLRLAVEGATGGDHDDTLIDEVRGLLARAEALASTTR